VQHGCVFRLQEHRLHGSDSQQSVSCTQKRHVPSWSRASWWGMTSMGPTSMTSMTSTTSMNPNNIFNLCDMYRVEPLLFHLANYHPLVDELSCAGFDFEPDVMPVRMLILSSTAFCVCLIHVGAVCHHVRCTLSRWARLARQYLGLVCADPAGRRKRGPPRNPRAWRWCDCGCPNATAPSLKQRWYACSMFDDQDGACNNKSNPYSVFP